MTSADTKQANISNLKRLEKRVMVHCPDCGWRIFDNISITSGILSVKCPKCKHVVEINLALRKT